MNRPGHHHNTDMEMNDHHHQLSFQRVTTRRSSDVHDDSLNIAFDKMMEAQHRPAAAHAVSCATNTVMDDDEFDLHRNYHHAIDCLMHCEHIISSLQDKLALKDQRIGGLEEKLVQMSLELASAKASEDEHRLFRRQMQRMSAASISSSSSSSDESSLDMSHKPEAEAQGLTSSELIVDYNPVRNSARSASLSSARGDAVTSPGSNIPHAPSVPAAIDENNATRNTKRSESPKPLRTFGLGVTRLAKRMSGVISNSDHPMNISMGSTLLDNSTHDSSRELAMHCFTRCESASFYKRNNGLSVRRSNSMYESRNAASTTARRTLNKQGSIADIGQFLLGRGNNNNKPNETIIPLKIKPQQPQHRRDSGSSSRSGISGVVFPVTSNDCLVGLNHREDTSFRERPIKRRPSNGRNEDWP